jgi:hypothetical protein
MANSSAYKLTRDCSITSAQLALLLHEPNPVEREKIVRKAKFPKVPAVIQYQESRAAIRRFLGGNATRLELEAARDQARASADAETNHHVKMRHRLNAETYDAFLAQYDGHNLHRFEVIAVDQQIAMAVEGVRIKTQLDALLQEERTGVTSAGGLLLITSQSEASRKNIKDRLKTTANLMHWTMTITSQNLPPKPRLCIVWDMADDALVASAPTYARMQTRVEASCREIDRAWNDVTPPPDYDGPPP